MNSYGIKTGSITYAIKARDILRRNGYTATVERNTSDLKGSGCGYSVTVFGDIEKPERLLREAGVKILQIEEK